jgi:hypothetical protein
MQGPATLQGTIVAAGAIDAASKGDNTALWLLAGAALAITVHDAPAAEGVLGSGRAYSVAFETTLEEVGAGTRAAHFKAANTALSESLSAETLEELGISVPRSNAGTILGESPSGWTWHHVPDQPGVMQLVPRAMHQGSTWQPLLHPGGVGGFKLWGADY